MLRPGVHRSEGWGLNWRRRCTDGVHRARLTQGNGCCESFNARFRDDLLNGEIFYSPIEAQINIEEWRRHDNTVRPHSTPGYRPPAPECFVDGSLAGHLLTIKLDHLPKADQRQPCSPSLTWHGFPKAHPPGREPWLPSLNLHGRRAATSPNHLQSKWQAAGNPGSMAGCAAISGR